ncbi:serine/threonine-protein kinase KIPK1-like [Zingiber officinale]|uniref:serine/threonine-protein kinase KIPK1-like n=1 Tax=Zingiber officinale TaxID=94328 RepID=UPI001C4D4C08|nr:serine/threonine-protein kinase KIPK1-like [Zingiber officinale]
MGSTSGTSEIVESNEALNLESYFGGSKALRIKLKSNLQDGKCQDLEDNLDQLLRAIHLRTSSRVLGPSSQPGVDSLRKNDTKKPVKVGVCRASGIGISESITLKQALRKSSIIQASEMAAMKKFSRPISFSGTPTIRRLCTSVMIPSSNLSEEKRSLVEISIMAEKVSADFSKTTTEFGQEKNTEMSVSHLSAVSTSKLTKIRIQDVIKPTLEESCESHSATVKLKKDIASSKAVAATSNTKVNPHLNKPVHRNNNLKKKGKSKASSAATISTTRAEVNRIGSTLSNSKQSQSKESAIPSCTIPRTKSCRLKEQLTTACSMPQTKSCYHKEPVTPASAAVSAESKILLSPNIHRSIRPISVNSSEVR